MCQQIFRQQMLRKADRRALCGVALKQPEQVCMHLRRLFIYADSPLVRVMKSPLA